ncbi:hypothetical protein PV318_04335 [Streptomyces sp. ME02-6991-2B]|nr:hypothetical protein [Streptomyces sp. ME02-6991-2B]
MSRRVRDARPSPGDRVVRGAEPHSSDAALDQLLHLRPGARVTTDAVPPADDRALI